MASRTRKESLVRWAQPLFLLAAIALALFALYPFREGARPATAREWWLLGSAFVLAVLAQMGLPVAGTAVVEPQAPVSRLRRVIGVLLFVAGGAVWLASTRLLMTFWDTGFDRAWVGWLAGASLMSVGLDLAWARWKPWHRPRLWATVLMIAVPVLLGAVYRFGNLREFPGPFGITQIEDLQFGNWGAEFLAGSRRRWEFIGPTWLAALGIHLGGPSMASVRSAYAFVSCLKIGLLFLWLRSSVGTVGALFAAGLLATSSWDVIQSRIPFNPNDVVVMAVFALLAGPARRGRPSAYVWLGMLSGYILWEYIAYRPLAVFAVVGGILCSIRDREASWWARLFRPLLTVAMVASVATPLFTTRLRDNPWYEYMNGLERARGVHEYYDPNHSWSDVFRQRLERAEKTGALLFFQGDLSPTRNVDGRPLVDPVTAVAMLLGLAFAVANWWRDLFGLYAVAFLATTVGTMVVTGDFNVLRMSVTIPYLYALAGCFAAGLVAAWTRLSARAGFVFAVACLAAALGQATLLNTRFLERYWSSDFVQRAQRSNRAKLVTWLGEHARPGERVIGVAPGLEDSLDHNDAEWLRGPAVPGQLSTDVLTALDKWQEPGPTLFVIFDWRGTRDLMEYVEKVVPGLEMHFEKDPINARGELAWGRIPDRPANLQDRIDRIRCDGLRADYQFVLEGGGVSGFSRVVPFIDLGTWPTDFEDRYEHAGRVREVRVKYEGTFRVERGGTYVFSLVSHPAWAQITIDGTQLNRGIDVSVPLDSGEHRFELEGVFPSMGRGIDLSLAWKGPDSGDELALIPFYEIAAPNTDCPAPRS